MTSVHRTQALDGLRGYAALSVTVYHGILHFDPSLIERVLYAPIILVPWPELWVKLLLIVFNGESAVIIFFILSGLVLRGAFERLATLPLPLAAAIFALRRATRIYPAVIACMILFYVMSVISAREGFNTFRHFALWQFVENAVLYAPVMHGPSWSMQVEICAVPFLIGAEWLRRRFGLFGLLIGMIYGLIAIEYTMLVLWLPALWPYLFAFLLGMLVAEPGLSRAVSAFPPLAGLAALLLFLGFRHVTERAAISGLIAQGMAGSVLVACLVYRHDALNIFLSNRVSLFLGRVSCSFYLFNVVALCLVWAVIEAWIMNPAQHAVGWGLLSAAVSVMLTIPTAACSERFIERPGIALGRAAPQLLLQRLAIWRSREATVAKTGRP